MSTIKNPVDVILTVGEVKTYLEEMIPKKVSSINREDNYLKEYENDKASFDKVTEDMNSSVAFPADSPYLSYANWLDALEKQMNTSMSSVSRINRERAELAAYRNYMENVTGE